MDTLDVIRGLSDRTRLRIALLLANGELCVCDLVAVLKAPQSTISRHMARLKSAGIVRDRRNGKWVYYRLSDEQGLKTLMRLLARQSEKDAIARTDLAVLKKLHRAKGCD